MGNLAAGGFAGVKGTAAVWLQISVADRMERLQNWMEWTM